MSLSKSTAASSVFVVIVIVQTWSPLVAGLPKDLDHIFRHQFQNYDSYSSDEYNGGGGGTSVGGVGSGSSSSRGGDESAEDYSGIALGSSTSKEADKLEKALLADMGIQRMPDVSKMNISIEEYRKMYRVYQESVLQTEILASLRQVVDNQPAVQRSLINKVQLRPTVTESRRRLRRSIVTSSERETGLVDKVHLHFSNQEILKSTNSESGNAAAVANSATLEVAIRFCRGKGAAAADDDQKTELVFSAHQLTAESDLDSVIAMDTHRIHLHELVKNSDGLMHARLHSEEEEDGCALTWIKMDVTSTVQTWLLNTGKNFGILIDCDVCSEHGLEVDGGFTRLDVDTYQVNKNSRNLAMASIFPDNRSLSRGATDCSAAKKSGGGGGGVSGRRRKERCCREKMRVELSEISTFRFIVQPTSFDAHVCRGRCPPRFNPTHDHSLLQSLLHLKTKHKGGKERIPRPCCAPTKLLPLDILHVDPNDHTKLKVTHWKNIVVAECGCS